MANRVTRSATQSVTKYVTRPVISTSPDQARASVLSVYKKFQKSLPHYWWDNNLQDIPLPVFRLLIKNQFLKNGHITDIRIIDRLVGECKQHIVSFESSFYNHDHVRNYLVRENMQPKPKDFLSKFFSAAD